MIEMPRMYKMTIEEARFFMLDPAVQEAADEVLESLGHLLEDEDPLLEEIDRWMDVFTPTQNSKKTWLAFAPQASDEFIITLAQYANRYGHTEDGDWSWRSEDSDWD